MPECRAFGRRSVSPTGPGGRQQENLVGKSWMAGSQPDYRRSTTVNPHQTLGAKPDRLAMTPFSNASSRAVAAPANATQFFPKRNASCVNVAHETYLRCISKYDLVRFACLRWMWRRSGALRGAAYGLHCLCVAVGKPSWGRTLRERRSRAEAGSTRRGARCVSPA